MQNRRQLIAAAAAALAGAPMAVRAEALELSTPSGPTIFATGGLFPGLPGSPVFGRQLLELSPKPRPRICFVGAADGDCAAVYDSFKAGLAELKCDIVRFNIFKPPTLDFAAFLSDVDIVFVGGGSTRNLTALWREWGFDRALVDAWRKGVIMSGGSAGALCWFGAGLSDSYPKVLSPVRGLDLLAGSADVHHHTRPDRQSRFRALIADGSLPSPGLALDEEVAVLYRGRELVGLYSAKEGAGAWLLSKTPDGVSERPLPVRLLKA